MTHFRHSETFSKSSEQIFFPAGPPGWMDIQYNADQR